MIEIQSSIRTCELEKYFNFDEDRYKFKDLVTNLFDHKLDELHLISNQKYDFFSAPGNDSETEHHKKFYDRMREGWPEFMNCYKSFINNFIAPIIGAKDNIVYQRWPTFRVHLPGNVAVGGWHRDSDYNHPPNEINFIVALTPMFESNTTIAEGTPGKLDFRQFTLNPGQTVMFDGNRCMHGNLPNMTGKTRVSFDFRVMLQENYNESEAKKSLSKGKKFIVGDYYDVQKLS